MAWAVFMASGSCPVVPVADESFLTDAAVMGCVVNGPGEAKEADIGIAGGDGCGVLIKHGEIIKKFEEDKLLAVLKDELDNWKD